MKTVAIDFETYYDDECSVTELGPEAYVRHPLFHAYCVSLVWNDNGVRGEWVGHPDNAPWQVLKGARAVAHNTLFEIAVVSRLMELSRFPVDCLPDEWSDTADLAAYLCLARRRALDEVMRVFKVTMDKAPRGQAKYKTGAEFMANPVLWKQICEYCLNDSRACLRVWEEFHEEWPEEEQLVATLTKMATMRGVRVDVKAAKEARVVLKKKIEECVKCMPWVQAGRKPMSILAFKETCAAHGLPVPESTDRNDEAYQEFLDTYAADYPWVKAMGELRKANRLDKVLAALERRANADGIVFVGLKYFGGHTGRWSGDEVNLQNLNKEPVFGINLRGVVLSRPQTRFVIFDFGQIEPRALFWTVGQDDFIELVRMGINPYEAFARQSLDWTGGELKSENKKLYAIAKQETIAPGYGQGAARMAAVLQQYRVDIGVDWKDPNRAELYLAYSEKEINKYRQRYWRVVEYWKEREAEFRTYIGQTTYAQHMPSGRDFMYYHIREMPEVDKSGRIRKSLVCSFYATERPAMRMWGGTITQNYIQAFCRDIVADRKIAVYRETGAFPVFTSHDELVYEVPANEAQDWYNYLEKKLCENPDWAPGLPLGVDGMITECYTK